MPGVTHPGFGPAPGLTKARRKPHPIRSRPEPTKTNTATIAPIGDRANDSKKAERSTEPPPVLLTPGRASGKPSSTTSTDSAGAGASLPSVTVNKFGG